MSDVCVFLYGRPPEHQLIFSVASQQTHFGDIPLVTMRGEVPLVLSKQEDSAVSLACDGINGLKIDVGIVHYSIADLLLYQITGKECYIATSIRQLNSLC